MDRIIRGNYLFTHKSPKRDFLGSGQHGRVFRCFGNDGAVRAVKLLALGGGKKEIEDTMNSIETEVKILKEMLRSDRVVNLIGVVKFEPWVGIVMDYMPRGNFCEIIRGTTQVPLVLIFRILYETAIGLSHLHSATFDKRVSHNDLKPSNVLLDHDFHAKICDFGGSDFVARTSTSAAQYLTNISKVHTTNYAAPEFLEGSYERRTRAMDVYSYGMVVYFALAAEHPFEKCHSDVVIDKVKRGERPQDLAEYKFDVEGEMNPNFLAVLQGVMKQCWDQTPQKRPTAKNVTDELKIHCKDIDRIIGPVVDELRMRCQLEEFEKDQDCISLENKCLALSVCHRTNERNVNAESQQKATMEDPKAPSGTASSIKKISVEKFTETLKKGDEVHIETPRGIFVCNVTKACLYQDDSKATVEH